MRRRIGLVTAVIVIGLALAGCADPPPPGLSSACGSMGSESDGAQGLRFCGADSPDYADPTLLVTIVPVDDGVGVRADGQAIWLPTRPASSYLPGSVSSVDVTVRRTSSVRRTLPAAPARRLAAAVNALPAATPARYSCPMSRGFHDDLLFHAPGRDVSVVVTVGGCGGVTVAGTDLAAGDIDQLVMSELGRQLAVSLVARS